MRRVILMAMCVALIALVAAPARAQELSKADRAELVKYLKKTRDNAEKATRGLSAEQLNFKPAPERWSVAQCIEHIAAAEDLLYATITNNVMKSPAPAEPFDPAKSHDIDAKVKAGVTDRSQKAQAPEALVPTNRFGSPNGSWQHFLDSRERTIAFAQNEKGLRAHAMDNPVAKGLDAYQWLLFLSAHSARHTAQILEVKADPNFPKK